MKVLHDNEGRPSSMRYAMAACVLAAIVLALGTLVPGVGMDDPTGLIATLLAVPMGSKLGQRFAENGGK